MNSGLLNIASIAGEWLARLTISRATDAEIDVPDYLALCDEKLFSQMQAGDQHALNAFILRHAQTVYACIRHRVWSADIADDLFQETWIRVIERCHTWRPGSSIRPWLYCVAINVINDHGRKSMATRRGGAITHVDLDATQHLIVSSSLPADAMLIQDQERTALHQAVMRVPDPFGEVVRLRYLEELSVAEVAEVMGCAEGTIKSRLARGLAMLQKELEAQS